MATIRKPFQGLSNIVRFNWHYYILSLFFILFLFIIRPNISSYTIDILIAFIIIINLTSLLASYYIYDLSSLSSLSWLDDLSISKNTIINIHAGFDDSSELINQKYPNAKLIVLDFFDPKKHTEISIKIARKKSRKLSNTIPIETSNIKLSNNSSDFVFLILSAHEIRNKDERVKFFKEINRILNNTGKIIVTEHLRDLPNFLAFNIGFFHFYSKNTWRKTFHQSNLKIINETKITPFITTFILSKDESSY